MAGTLPMALCALLPWLPHLLGFSLNDLALAEAPGGDVWCGGMAVVTLAVGRGRRLCLAMASQPVVGEHG